MRGVETSSANGTCKTRLPVIFFSLQERREEKSTKGKPFLLPSPKKAQLLCLPPKVLEEKASET